MVIGMMLPIAQLGSALDWTVVPARKRSSSPVVPWKLPPPKAGDDDARVLTDGLKSVQVIIGHEGVVSSKTTTERFHESARAILIHFVCSC